MSQKPRTGAQGKPGLAPKGAPKEAATKSTPIKTAAAADEAPEAKAEPMAEAESVMEAQPVVEIEPVAEVEPMTEAESVIEAQPVAEVESMVEAPPMVEAEPMVEAAPVSLPEPVVAPLVTAAETAMQETITTTTEAVPALAEVIAEPLNATVEPVASFTAQTVRTANAILPTQTTLTRGMKTMMKSTEDFVAFGQANLEAFVKSGQIWSAGVQELTKQIATSAKASFEESVSTFKAISTAKSVKEAMELQSTFAKATLEKAMAESNKLTDASIKLTEQTLAPITARVSVAVETFGKTA